MIKILNLNFKINGNKILSNINLNIKKGGITVLIGPNGAGKSTLLSLISRLNPIQTGKITIEDLDISTSRSDEIAKKIAILTQENNIQNRITVRDILAFGRFPYSKGYLKKLDYEILEEVLTQFSLNDLSNRYLSSLSGGQKQRALIAMCFCQKTDYLLLDEPLNNLDIFHARELMHLIKKLTKELNLTTIMVLHDINFGVAYADHIIGMKAGKVIIEGSVKDVINVDTLKELFNVSLEIIKHKDIPIILDHL